VEVVASLSQSRTAAAQCGLFTHKSVPVIFEPPCVCVYIYIYIYTYMRLPRIQAYNGLKSNISSCFSSISWRNMV